MASTLPTSGAARASGFDADHFSLFGLPRRYAVDRAELDAAWRELQAKVHPDRHAAATDAAKRVALQWASRVNEAYRVLRSPLLRARYLCELAGHDVQAESNTAMAPAFLMQQMQWREELDVAKAAGDPQAYAGLSARLDAARTEMQARLGRLLDGDTPDYPAAVGGVREWMFLERLSEEIEAAQY